MRKVEYRTAGERVKLVNEAEAINESVVLEEFYQDKIIITFDTICNQLPKADIINQQVIAKIRERYTIDEEFKMLNYGIADPEDPEYLWYRDYVQECRAWGQTQKDLLIVGE